MALSGFDHNVRWNEFRQVNQRPAGVQEDAQIRTRTVAFTFRTRQPAGQNCAVTDATVSIAVDGSRSWVVRDQQRDALLQHEQGHYDIAALGTRDLYNRVLGLTAARCPDINIQAQRLQNEIQAQITATDLRYDNQTSHGNNTPMQQTWTSRIQTAKRSATGTLADLP
jgi:predicted secreted Zn-dependent protease